jgi:hypothetical protein
VIAQQAFGGRPNKRGTLRKPASPTGSALEPINQVGNIYLPHPDCAPWVTDFIEECCSLPNGAHDDQVDAMTQLLLRWHAPQEEQVFYYSERVVISEI